MRVAEQVKNINNLLFAQKKQAKPKAIDIIKSINRLGVSPSKSPFIIPK